MEFIKSYEVIIIRLYITLNIIRLIRTKLNLCKFQTVDKINAYRTIIIIHNIEMMFYIPN